MSTLQVRITDLATRVATEIKSVKTLVNGNAADLSALTTTQKTSLVAAINELKNAVDNVGSSVTISDSTSSTTQVWSSSKIASEIQAAKDALGYRLRFDTAQTLTTGQKTQACANLGIGEPDTDFVTTFNSGLV